MNEEHILSDSKGGWLVLHHNVSLEAVTQIITVVDTDHRAYDGTTVLQGHKTANVPHRPTTVKTSPERCEFLESNVVCL
jgi:hypothetical protein